MPSKVILHIDMDAFFASVEQRDNPSLRGRAVVIGADPKSGRGRGVVSTCSYEARKYGIHSAMPISKAYQLCPQAVFLPVRMKKYAEVSRQIFEILYDFTPDIEPISVDEAFLDITGSFHFYKTPYATAQIIKERIKKETGLTASIGIAPVKFVAKIASDASKPDGLLEIKKENLFDFLWPLDIGRLWGVGPKTKAVLNAMNIKTIGELARIPLVVLRKHFGEHGEHLFRLANGQDERDVVTEEEIKSVSHEHTFECDTSDKEVIYETILDLSERVSRRLRKHDLKGKNITLKIRLAGFKTFTRAATIPQRTNFTDTINQTAKKLFNEFYGSTPPLLAFARKQWGRSPSEKSNHPERATNEDEHFDFAQCPSKCPEPVEGERVEGLPHKKVRLLGVRVSHFTDPYIKESLFEDKASLHLEKIHSAIDSIKDKFGESAIRHGGASPR